MSTAVNFIGSIDNRFDIIDFLAKPKELTIVLKVLCRKTNLSYAVKVFINEAYSEFLIEQEANENLID